MGATRILLFAYLAYFSAAIIVLENTPRNVTLEFEQFEQEYNKHYLTPAERKTRFAIFAKNMELAAARNAEGHAVYGSTKFADLTLAEFKRQYTGRNSSSSRRPADYDALAIENVSAVTAIDWRTKGAVTPVKDQGNCGSCWTFGTTGAIEGAWFVAGNKLISLSEQQILDCDTKTDNGCDGGEQATALDYVIKAGGIEGEDDYAKYTHKQHKCTFATSKVRATIKSWKQLSTDEATIASQVATVGPMRTFQGNETSLYFAQSQLLHAFQVTIGVCADDMQLYKKGIAAPSKAKCSHSELDHAVLIVGFDTAAATPYWIIKNSWGTDWGEDGYYRAKFGEGVCGLNKDVQAAFA